MKSDFLIYGSTGFVGRVIARRAIEQGFHPILAGRSPEKVKAQAEDLGLDYRVFGLDHRRAMEQALDQVELVLNCAGPFIHTFEPMVEACLRQRTQYLDITGEIQVMEQLANRNQRASERGVMIMPSVGFDVVATDCLAVHLKQRLPTANKLTLAFHSEGPAGIPPGTARIMIELLPRGIQIRRDGRIIQAPNFTIRRIDFGDGPRRSMRLSWGDLIAAYHSTGIQNVENYAVLPSLTAPLLAAIRRLRPLFRLSIVKGMIQAVIPTGSTEEERAETVTHVWGEVVDEQGRRAVSRLHGPEAGVDWTVLAAWAVVSKVLEGEFQPGFQTPASVFGPDFVLEGERVWREDLVTVEAAGQVS